MSSLRVRRVGRALAGHTSCYGCTRSCSDKNVRSVVGHPDFYAGRVRKRKPFSEAPDTALQGRGWHFAQAIPKEPADGESAKSVTNIIS